MLRRVALARTDISEEHMASIINGVDYMPAANNVSRN
jgi:hypothetical protein